MSYYIEKDDSMTADVWRIVDSRDADRMRELGTSCRPMYAATAYSYDIAKKVCDLLNKELLNAAMKKFAEELAESSRNRYAPEET